MLHDVVGAQDDAHLVRYTSCTHARTLVNKKNFDISPVNVKLCFEKSCTCPC